MLSNMRYHTSVIISLFGALGTLGSASRKLMKLGAYADRLREMEAAMGDIRAGRLGGGGAWGLGLGAWTGAGWRAGRPQLHMLAPHSALTPARSPTRAHCAGALGAAEGQLLACDDAIVFEEAVVVTPGGHAGRRGVPGLRGRAQPARQPAGRAPQTAVRWPGACSPATASSDAGSPPLPLPPAAHQATPPWYAT